MPEGKLNLEKFRELNATRAAEGFKTYKNVPITYWTTALAGEVGELCNMIKKMERVAHGGIDGGTTYTAANIKKADLQEEIGGIAIYLDLLASLLGISLQEAIIETFNSKSYKYNLTQYLPKNKDESPSSMGVDREYKFTKEELINIIYEFLFYIDCPGGHYSDKECVGFYIDSKFQIKPLKQSHE
jgi:NTP pyrophosphatase (non-canonical NTP hydrolase)